MATTLKLTYCNCAIRWLLMHHLMIVLLSETTRWSTFTCHPFIIHSHVAKVTLPLCSSKQRAITTYEGGGMAPCILTSALNEGEYAQSLNS
jgi:hypothetical protein